jgi:hypothetical protein
MSAMGRTIISVALVDQLGVVETFEICDEDLADRPDLAETLQALGKHHRDGSPAPFGIGFMCGIIGEPIYAHVVGFERIE